MIELDIRLFGSAAVERHGAPIEVDTRKAIALLARLALEPGPHARDALAVWLWPESDEQHARAALRRTLSSLVKALDEGRIAVTRETIGLGKTLGLLVDVNEFRERVRTARGPATGEAAVLRALDEAAALYRGDFLEGFSLRDSPEFDDWQAYQAESLRRELAWVLERTVALLAARGDFAQAIEPARRWLAIDPLHEPAHRWLMQCYAECGRQAAALNQYRECVRLLETELGVAPLAETTALYEAIRDRRVSRGAPPVELPPEAPEHQPPDGLGPRAFPLVGRVNERARLRAAYAGLAEDGYLIVIEGEAGIGKSRLAEDLAAAVRSSGGLALIARCYEGETDLAYGPLVELLRAGLILRGEGDWMSALPSHAIEEAARLVPELLPSGRRGASGSDSPGARARFFAACADVLLTLVSIPGGPPGLVVLDDLHWADDGTLEFLGWLARRLDQRPLLVVGTWRAEEASSDHPLRRMLSVGERAGRAERVEVARLSRQDVDRLVEAATGDVALGGRLFEETEGLPFFVVEYLSELATQPDPARDWPAMPKSVREILRSRVARAGEVGRQLLSTGAAIGRSFDFDTLRAVSGRSEDEVITGVEQLLGLGLLSESSGPDATAVYDFSHERLRAFVYAETSLARRRLLHRRIGETLSGRGAAQPAAQIAHHFRLAGLDALAAEQFWLAANQARAVYAHADALSHLQAALALGYPDPAEVHGAIGDLQALLGDYAAAQASYEAALAFTDPDATPALADLEQRIGVLCQRLGEWERSERHFHAAEPALSAAGPGRYARLLADWSLSAHHLGDDRGAEDRAAHALALASQAKDERVLALTWNILGVLARAKSDLPEARRCLEASLALAEGLGNRDAQAAALNNLALVHAAGGDVERAITLAQAALAHCVATGDRHREAAILNNLADFLHLAGRTEDAMGELTRSVAIYAEIGTVGGQPQPEIWKLVEW